MSREISETPTLPTSFCLFQEPWWLNLTTDGHWDEALVANNQGVIARLPYRRLRRFGATILTQPRLTPYARTLVSGHRAPKRPTSSRSANN